METRFIEAESHNKFNWGKFLLCRLDRHELEYQSALSAEYGPTRLVSGRAGDRGQVLLIDLQTGEGAWFTPERHSAVFQLEKHKIWVCLLYEPLLEWIFKQDLSDFTKLPPLVRLHCNEGLVGRRRPGPQGG